MGVPQKVALTVTFLLGYLNPVISIIRLAYVVELGPKIEDPDVTWDFANFAIWSFVECSIALISACVPSLQFLFVRIINALNGLATPHELTHRTKSSGQNTDTTTKQGLAHQGGSFARLKDERANSGFARAQNRYEVSAYKKYGVMGEEMELESQKPAAAETAQILVSKSVDVVSRAGSEEPKVRVGYT
ncbi:MAG: hypothetical protein ASARMPRED_006620 [Alectoria sarmentosa]|nr:MAG: hypothetical protein ASARMPRED_006620 [Alectoria sarmentosa]